MGTQEAEKERGKKYDDDDDGHEECQLSLNAAAAAFLSPPPPPLAAPDAMELGREANAAGMRENNPGHS